MAFSGALTITDLDDFLTPSQACIIPVRGAKAPGNGDGPTEIHIDSNNQYYEVSTYSTSAGAGPSTPAAKKALEKAEINLNDCLACSGCITSTESMLITLQSQNEVLSFIASNPKTIDPDEPCHLPRVPILSISPQTLASLSAAYSTSSSCSPIPLLVLLRRIRSFLSQPDIGGWKVWDTTFARHLSLRESVTEYHERRDKKDKGKSVELPVLASACPGWVCYAEKAQGDMLPLMSAARSSQAIVGALAKTWYGGKIGRKPNEIYHVTAMPCYDKKLEASRSDFYSSLYSTRDVDCVLTTGELDLLLQELGFNPYTPVADEDIPSIPFTSSLESPFPEMLTHDGSSSGSYLATIIRDVQSSHPNPTKITTREIRGSTDNVEYLVHDIVTGELLFKGAKVFGFRNLQNLVRKVGKETGIGRAARSGAGAGKLSLAVAARRRKAKAASSGSGIGTPTTDGGGSDAESLASLSLQSGEDRKLDFVEVMACPGGCVNGGGQMKPVQPQAQSQNIAEAGEKMEVDEEGYQRPLPDDGSVATSNLTETSTESTAVGVVTGTDTGVEEGMRWSTKEWVSKVESIYWMGLPTPPPSPPLTASNLTNQPDQSWPMDKNGSGHAKVDRSKMADEVAEQIVQEACGDDSHKRWEFLRTRYRKVESDILSNGVTHEAVKW